MDGSLCDLRDDVVGDGPLVTVVVPVYNTPEGPLRRCLRSILSQDYANIELIVVDDGSSGECVAVLNDALGADPRSRVIGGALGVSHARNLGIDSASGEWVVFCDSDDELLPSFISDALKVALSLGVEFICGANTHLYEGDSANPAGFTGRYHAVFEQGQMAAAAKQMLGMVKYAGFDGPDFKGRGPHGRLYNRKALGSLRYDENLAIGEDVLFNYEFIMRCRSLAIVDACWYAYYQYCSSAVHASDLPLWKTSIESTISACAQGEDPAPYYTRCAELTFEAVASFARAEGLISACDRGKSLLSFADNLGCFSEECLRGYLPPRSLDIYVRLCRKGLYGAACWFWGSLTLIRDRASNRRLIDPLPYRLHVVWRAVRYGLGATSSVYASIVTQMGKDGWSGRARCIDDAPGVFVFNYRSPISSDVEIRLNTRFPATRITPIGPDHARVSRPQPTAHRMDGAMR